MPRPSRPWFRVYVEMCHDLKVKRLVPAERWLWVVLLAIARQSPIPGCLLVTEDEPCEMVDIALWATMPLDEVERGVERMLAKGMLEKDAGGSLYVSNWNERQFESDDVTSRTARYRERRRNVPKPFPGTDDSVSVSASVSESTDQEKAMRADDGTDRLPMSPLWASCLTVLQEQVSQAVWDSTFTEIGSLSRADKLVLIAPNPWVKERIESRYLALVQAALSDLGSPELPIEVELHDENLAEVHHIKRDSA